MSKYLEYTRYANTGATKDVAPVLGTFLNRDKLALEALCEEIKLNGGTPMDTETLLYIISGTIDYLREHQDITAKIVELVKTTPVNPALAKKK